MKLVICSSRGGQDLILSRHITFVIVSSFNLYLNRSGMGLLTSCTRLYHALEEDGALLIMHVCDD